MIEIPEPKTIVFPDSFGEIKTPPKKKTGKERTPKIDGGV